MSLIGPVPPADDATALRAELAALRRSLAVIEFTPDGHILTANENFLRALGYRTDELPTLRGRHHRVFMDPDEVDSPEYAAFWAGLAAGEAHEGEFRRRTKTGDDIWIQATYAPVFGADGRVGKVVKYASDITARVVAAAENTSQIAAIDRAQAVISFALDGTILDANDHFLAATGYRRDEIVGRHHRIFMPPGEAEGPDYQAFWSSMAAGAFHAGEFRRVTKAGDDLWIQASYNPIFDPQGKPFKVVKYASDITERVMVAAENAGQIAAIGRSQAVISFALDGTILEANDNFLAATGYRRDEVVGRHHSIFMPPGEATTGAYTRFWEGLRAGSFQSGEFRRVTKTGDDLWIQASYNPIFDPQGKPFKVVKYASDITKDKQASLAAQAALAELRAAAVRGDLGHRADTQGLHGSYLEMVEGVHEVIDAIVAPIRLVSAGLRTLAEGDLRTRIQGEFAGEHAASKEALDTALDALNSMLRGVRSASQEMAAGSSQVAAASNQLSEGATRQAAAVEEMVSMMESIRGQVGTTATKSREAAQLSSDAGGLARAGNTRMKAMNEAMAAISESSHSIAKIIKVIDEIAFQTNLLALNAAVEAARAGAQGKGFAVVAEEVRSLAARSASAARETTEYIEEAVQRVSVGSKLTREMASSLVSIVASVDQVVDLVGEIAEASRHQADAVTQVSEGLTVIDQVTQTNTATSEETAAASTELSAQAQRLDEELQRFQLADLPAPRADAVAGLSPEMMRAFQAFMSQSHPAMAR